MTNHIYHIHLCFCFANISMFSHGFPMVFLLFLWFPRPRKGRSPGMLAMACQLVQSHGPRRLLSGAGATLRDTSYMEPLSMAA